MGRLPACGRGLGRRQPRTWCLARIRRRERGELRTRRVQRDRRHRQGGVAAPEPDGLRRRARPAGHAQRGVRPGPPSRVTCGVQRRDDRGDVRPPSPEGWRRGHRSHSSAPGQWLVHHHRPLHIHARWVVAGSRGRSRRPAGVPVGEHLADQLLVPLAMAGGGSYVTTKPTERTRTNIDVVRMFLDVGITVAQSGSHAWTVTVSKPSQARGRSTLQTSRKLHRSSGANNVVSRTP